MASPELVSVLRRGGIAVMPTDTIYGVVAQAHDRNAVARLYAIRRKTPQKPFIILIDSIERLREFGITPAPLHRAFLEQAWPGAVSVILPCDAAGTDYLHLGTKTLAFRLPNSEPLLSVLKETGPLVAPSANPEGSEPARNIEQAKAYFNAAVDRYEDGGELFGAPSTLVSLLGSKPEVLRQGAADVSKFL